MKLAFRTGGVTRSAARWHIRKSAVSRTVERARLRTPAGLKVFYESLAGGAGITVSTTDVRGGTIRDATAPVTTAPVTATVTGGIPPYTHNWVYESGANTASPTDPTSATTSFIDGLAPGDSWTTVFHDVVTDAAGVSANSPSVTAHFTNMGDTL